MTQVSRKIAYMKGKALSPDQRYRKQNQTGDKFYFFYIKFKECVLCARTYWHFTYHFT